MGYSELILIINIVSVVVLFMMGLLLCEASRFKGEASYAVLIIMITSIPTYLFNIASMLQWNNASFLLAPFAFSSSLTLMPLIYFLVHMGFDSSYRFKPIYLLHFLPSFAMFGLSCAVLFLYSQDLFSSSTQLLSDITYFVQLLLVVAYLFAIFRYMRKVKRFVCNHFSDSELLHKIWIPRFMLLFSFFFSVSMIAYGFFPKTYAWLNQLLNIVSIYYLLYSGISSAFYERYNSKKELKNKVTVNKNQVLEKSEDITLLEKYASEVENYLAKSEAYINPNLSLNEVADAMGVSYKNLSKAINVVLDRNFFNLINSYRIEKSKGLLLSKRELGLTLDSIAEMCGFNSRFTFNTAFKKATGLTSSQWLKKQSK